MMFRAAARARRRSLCTTSSTTWSLVYECTVFMKPVRIPNVWDRTFAVTDRQFVVHEPLLMIRCFAGSYTVWLTPMLTVRSSPVAGALITTRLAPPARCPAAFAASVKWPVDSITRSTPRSPHGSFAGSRSESTATVRPLMTIARSRASTVPGNAP